MRNKTRKWAYSISPSHFKTSFSTSSSLSSGLNRYPTFRSKYVLMSSRFLSSLDCNSNGFKCFNFSAMFVAGRVVTRKRIQDGSLQNWFAITSRSSFRPWYSLSSRPSIIISMFRPGSLTGPRGSLKSNANNSSTFMLLRSSAPWFLVNCSTRASLYFGRAWDKWQAKDWIINWGLR